MSTRHLTPAKGLHVMDPTTMLPLPTGGARVQGNDEYWMRRMNDGDVTERKPTATKEPT